MRTLAAVSCVALATLAALAGPVDAQATVADNDEGVVRSGRLVIRMDDQTHRLVSLQDETAGISWLSGDSPLWRLDDDADLTAELAFRPLGDGEVALTLTLHNPTDQPITTGVSFPRLEGLSADDPANLHYCYPRQDLILGNKPTHLDEQYSGRFPMQFVSAYLPGRGGIYLMTCDTQLHRKRYRLTKADHIDMGAYYPDVFVGPGETVVLPEARLGVHPGDWHGAFDAYRRWVAQWYQPAVERKPWLRAVFNFRQVFLYPNLDTPGLFDPADGTLSIKESIEADRVRFGQIDYVHIFDWSQTPDQGRVGMYDPWHHLPLENFNREIKHFQERGVPVGLYFEGYLVSPAADLPGRPGRAWQLQSQDGGRYDPFGSGDDYLCPAVPEWRDYLANAVLRVAQETPADGFYIDQLGFGYQYPCHDPTHGHATPSNQPRAEALLMRQVREALEPARILYSEQTPVDVALQYQDASFSYAMLHARHPACPSRTNLTRFAFPDFKTIQILRGDGPIGDDVEGIHLLFYQGDGVWLVGPSDNPAWYSPAVLEAIRKTRDLRETYMDAFTSDDATPLVPTLIDGVYANRFADETQTVWTLYNATGETTSAPTLRVQHAEGATYFDAWHQRELQPTLDNGWATLEVELPPAGIGCIVRTLRQD